MEIPTTWSTVYTSPWGDITLAARDQGPQGVLVGAWFKGQAHALSTLRGPLVPAPDHPVLRDAVTWLERYVAGERPRPTQLPLLAEGTAFRQLVWSLLETIPYGTTLTYR